MIAEFTTDWPSWWLGFLTGALFVGGGALRAWQLHLRMARAIADGSKREDKP